MSPQSRTLDKILKVRRQINLIATCRLKPMKLGPKQAAVLHKLLLLGSASLAELSRETGTDPAATTRVVDFLTRKRWVAQSSDLSDRRRRHVRLTPAGAELARKVHALHAELSAMALAPLSGAERETLHALLTQVTLSLSETVRQRTKPHEHADRHARH